MNFDIDLLITFRLVAYYNSISRASKKLCITQPSVSKKIKRLEDELGITLFVREKKGMKLTEEGKALYNFIIPPLNNLKESIEIIKNINNVNSGCIRIGASLSTTKYFLEDSIYIFKKLYPNVLITIKNSDPTTLYNEFKNGTLDIIFLNSTFNVSKSFKKNKIIDIEDCFFCSKEYYEKIKNINDLDKFILQNIIVQNDNFDTRNYFTTNYLKNNVKFKPIMEVDRNNILIDFVLKGIGIGFATSEYLSEYIKNDQIVILNTKLKTEKRYVAEIHRNERNNKVNNFLNILNKQIKLLNK